MAVIRDAERLEGATSNDIRKWRNLKTYCRREGENSEIILPLPEKSERKTGKVGETLSLWVRENGLPRILVKGYSV